ncbi:MAG: hypothetical protein A2W91_05555 [Bacteroidetes bacterium GWF2_38_335]|nr:MAG: hypothetical protein A2W91_05555 [Bacteroidetes bacterium GWF2_38_335]HBS88090.1 hypothetical protein [Bacteroidales bacterium]
MKTPDNILEKMIENELGENRAFSISHHFEDNPKRIDVKRDETVFVTNIKIVVSANFWLEYHSAIESRLVEKQVNNTETIFYEIITKHKGNVYFTKSHNFEYQVSYTKLKIIK